MREIILAATKIRVPRMRCELLMAALAFILLVPAQAPAQVKAFSKFGPGKSFQQQSGYLDGEGSVIYGPASHVKGIKFIAGAFVSGASGPLDYLDLALANYGAQAYGDVAAGASVALVNAQSTGIGSTQPDTNVPALEEWVTPTLPDYQLTAIRATRLVSKLHPVLTAGRTYYIVVTPSGFDAFDVWEFNSTGETGSVEYIDDDVNAWFNLIAGITPAFDVWIE